MYSILAFDSLLIWMRTILANYLLLLLPLLLLTSVLVGKARLDIEFCVGSFVSIWIVLPSDFCRSSKRTSAVQ